MKNYQKIHKYLWSIFAVENIKLFIYDSYGIQIHTEGKSILVNKTYKIYLFGGWIGSLNYAFGIIFRLNRE